MTKTTNDSPQRDKARLLVEHPEARELTIAIFEALDRDRQHTQSLLDHAWGRDRARLAQLRHGIASALNSIPWGGTTRDYEQGLDRLRWVLHPPQQVLDWYESQVDEHEGFTGSMDFTPYPGYRIEEGEA